MNKIISIVAIIVFIGLVGFLIFNSNVGDEYQREEIQEEQNEEPKEELSQGEKEVLVSNYIKENISTLSPEPEVLGGTFYVTKIEFNDAKSGTVEYEDGHIAIMADFEYSITEQDQIKITLSNVRQ